MAFNFIVYFDVSNVNLPHHTFSTCEDSVLHTFLAISLEFDFNL